MASESDLIRTLPETHRVSPYITPNRVPDFADYYDGMSFSFCPEPVSTEPWFASFANRIRSCMSREYLPVCRLADGEFKMLFWPVAPNPRLAPYERAKELLRTAWQMARVPMRGFEARTTATTSSGNIYPWEWRSVRKRSSACFLKLGREGVLALHLSVGVRPFQEEYFPSIAKWLRAGRHELTLDNYVPFYFVYALLRGPRGAFLFEGTRICVVHSAAGERRSRIIKALEARGARTIDWVPISPRRAFEDDPPIDHLVGKCDVCFVGAGLGKGILIDKLRPLKVPVIDAGFVFEVWDDESLARTRPMLIPDFT